MTTHLVTFSDESMSHSAALCIDSAEANGVNSHSRMNPGNILSNEAFRPYWPVFRELFFKRGCGYWAWKPLIIKAELDFWNDGDVILYADAGIEFINNVNYIIDRMDQGIFLFGNNWEHAHWCKRDIIELVWPEAQRYHGESYDEYNRYSWRRFSKQVQASVIFFRVSDYTRQFVKEWLDWCLFEGGRLIDDSPSRTPNHPEFREHRHDQAILTTLAYREGLKLHYWPASYNDGAFNYEKLPEYSGDDYPILFNHHRRRDHEWAAASIGNLATSLERLNDVMSKAQAG